MTRIGYARVSTREQNDDSQLDELAAAGCGKIFKDKASGKLARRPEWDACLEYLRPGDTLVITRLSRAARSLRNLLEVTDQLRERGIDLIVLKQQIDTTSPTGRLVFHILAAIDEFQRELIVEGTHEGLAAARARGRKGGRPVKMTPEKTAVARQMYDEQVQDGGQPGVWRSRYTVEQIAGVLGVSPSAVYRAFAREKAA